VATGNRAIPPRKAARRRSRAARDIWYDRIASRARLVLGGVTVGGDARRD